MTAYTKGAKLRAKKKRTFQDQIDKWRRQEPRRSRREEDPRLVAFEARKRVWGIGDDALDPMTAEEAGVAIKLGAESKAEARHLWQVYTSYDGVDDRYCKFVIGKQRFEAVSKLEFLPERLETRPDDRPDLRTEEEKIRDARNNWHIWQGFMGELERWERTAINRSVRREDELVKDGELTVHGKALVRALRALRRAAEK